jgi:hypothetical protein
MTIAVPTRCAIRQRRCEDLGQLSVCVLLLFAKVLSAHPNPSAAVSLIPPKIGHSLRQGLAPADKLLARINKTNAAVASICVRLRNLQSSGTSRATCRQTRASNPGRRCHCCCCSPGFADTALITARLKLNCGSQRRIADHSPATLD